ncbi:STAS domain-containing protein [Paenibacillus chungangensis]|uniref:STAS domain-containing protein n=1 Tax=Paenibacillus chungangensis TaxID=696535 RepID=A0ABW3HPB7_9BACL
MNKPLRVAMRQEGNIWVIDLQGDLAKSAETDLFLLQNWENGLEQGGSFLIFNFTEVRYINSLGIAVLIRIVRALHKAGCPAFAYGLSSHYAKLFRMVGLTQFMTLYDDKYTILQRIERLEG